MYIICSDQSANSQIGWPICQSQVGHPICKWDDQSENHFWSFFFKVAREGQIDIFWFLWFLDGAMVGDQEFNVLRKFETIWTSGSLVITVCSLKLKTDFSNLQTSFRLPRRKYTGKYNFQVSKLYVFLWHGCTRSTKQVQPCTVPHRTTATRPSSTRTRMQKVKARWRTPIQPSLEQSELFSCFSLL